MADYKVTDTQLSSIANAIRTRGGTSAPLEFPAAFVSAIENIPSGSSPVLVSKSISQNGTYNPSDDNADAYSQVVVNVSGGGSDDNFLITCKAMSGSIYDTNLSVVPGSLFSNNNYITGVEMTSASLIQSSAFCNCRGITAISFPACVSVGGSAFNQCVNLASVYLPICETISSSAFNVCCNKLKEVDLPMCRTIGERAFSSCWSLEKVTLRSCTTIGGWAFYRCSRLTELTILTESVCRLLDGGSTFDDSGLYDSYYTGRYGSVYVPASLVEIYKSAAYWSAISDRITSYVEE